MPRMVADAPCYVNENLWKPGEEFDYDGPAGKAFHVKGDEPSTHPDIYRTVDDKLAAMAGEKIKSADGKKK